MIFDELETALGPLVAGRFYRARFPQETGLPTMPAILASLVSSTSDETVCGTDDEDTDDARIQIDIVARTPAEMDSVKAALITAMRAVPTPNARVGLRESWDAETKAHRASLDYIFYPSSPI